MDVYAAYLEKVASIEYRGKTFPGYNKPIASDRANKKMMVLAKKGDEVRLIHFGQKGYKHNYSEAAKKNYLARSAGIRGKGGGLTKDDKFSANYWARKVLWPKGPVEKTAEKRDLMDRGLSALPGIGTVLGSVVGYRDPKMFDPRAFFPGVKLKSAKGRALSAIIGATGGASLGYLPTALRDAKRAIID